MNESSACPLGKLLPPCCSWWRPRRFDPGLSTGLDGSLRTLATWPFGELALLVVAFGFAVFGVYCFFQSRYRKV